MTGAHSAKLKWRKPRKLNGRIVLFKIKMLWRYKNIQGNYKETTRKIPAKMTTRERRGRFRRDVLDYAVLQLGPAREIELRRMQPFAFISMWVSEGTGALNTEVFWSPWSNNYTVETSEGGNKLSIKLTEVLQAKSVFFSSVHYFFILQSCCQFRILLNINQFIQILQAIPSCVLKFKGKKAKKNNFPI